MSKCTSRTFIVTGGTKGIGRAVVERLVAQGHRAIALARTPPPEDFAGDFISVDLADKDATLDVALRLASEHNVDGIVNNVGLVRAGAIYEVHAADLADVLDLTLRPGLVLTQAVLPSMISRGFGRVVNISSLTALGMPNRTSYAAAKGALISLTRSWALELARTGITVNSIAPGPTETEMFRQNNPHGSPGEQRYLAVVPMGRLGAPCEISAAICFFLSDESSFVTGQTLFVDGGASIGRIPA